MSVKAINLEKYRHFITVLSVKLYVSDYVYDL